MGSAIYMLLAILVLQILTSTHSFLRGRAFMYSHTRVKGAAFELGGDNSNNFANVDSNKKGSGSSTTCTDEEWLACYFDKHERCRSSNNVCPVDGRRCSADRAYLDHEYGSRLIITEEIKKLSIQQQEGLLYSWWGGDLSNSTITKDGGTSTWKKKTHLLARDVTGRHIMVIYYIWIAILFGALIVGSICILLALVHATLRPQRTTESEPRMAD